MAGATGNLGERIVRELLKRGVEVRALVRPNSSKEKVDKLNEQGVQIAEADTSDTVQITKACEGVSCVVDNARYSNIQWTSPQEWLSRK